jgi:hypothetical protein
VTDLVYASLASIPSREPGLRKVIGSLRGQVDVLRVYLNGYKHVPDILRHRKVVVARSQDHGDLGDRGKFFWCENAEGYQFVCDDDIIYPADYVSKLKEAIERHSRLVVVGLHGVTLGQQMVSYYKSRFVRHFSGHLGKDTPVHLLGTGCAAYHASTLPDLKRAAFQTPNMADIWLGLHCQERAVPMVAIPRRRGWMKLLETKSSIYMDARRDDKQQTDHVRSLWPWKLPANLKALRDACRRRVLAATKFDWEIGSAEWTRRSPRDRAIGWAKRK